MASITVEGTATPAPTEPPPPVAAQAPTPSTPAGPPSPGAGQTPFSGQVSNAGGPGNTRSDLDAAYGPPVGETPEHLVVYRKNNLEYHVGFVPEPNGRAELIVVQPQANRPPLTLELAMAEAAIPPDVFTANKDQPGQFLVVYVKDRSGRIARFIIGPGNDPLALITQGREAASISARKPSASASR